MYIRSKQQNGLKISLWAIIAFFAATIVGSTLIANSEPPSASNIKKWVQTEPYDAQRLRQYRDKNRPIFVYFTADWCVTCKINEASAIQREEMAQYFADNNIVVMEGDFTLREPEIANVLNQYGRAGVPLYLYFTPDFKTKILPQLLSVETLKSELKTD